MGCEGCPGTLSVQEGPEAAVPGVVISAAGAGWEGAIVGAGLVG